MAEEVKGFEIHLSLNAEEVNKGLKKVSSELSEQQRKLKDINARLRFDPKNTTLLNEKAKLLNQTITSTKTKLELMNQKLAKSGELLRQGKISDREFKAVQASVDKTKASLQTLNLELYKTKNNKWEGIEQLGQKLTKVSAIAIATATAITALVKKGVSSLANEDEYSKLATPEQIQSAKELNETVKEIRSSLTAVAGDIAKSVLPLVRQLSQFVSEKLAPAIKSVAEKFGSLPDQVQKLAVGMAGVLAVMPMVISTAGKLGGAVTNLLGSGSTGLLGLVASHPAVFAVVTALAGLFAYGYSTSDEFRQSVTDLGKAVKDILGSAVASLKGYFEEIKPYLKDVLDSAVAVLKDAVQIITKAVNLVKPLFASLMKIQTFFQSKATEMFLKTVERIMKAVEPAVKFIGDILDMLQPVFDIVTDAMDKVEEFSESLIGKMFNDIKTFLKPLNDFFDRIQGIKNSMIGQAIQWMLDSMREIAGFFEEVGENVSKWWNDSGAMVDTSQIPSNTFSQPFIDSWNTLQGGNVPMMANKTFNVTINTTADHMSLDDLDRQLGNM